MFFDIQIVENIGQREITKETVRRFIRDLSGFFCFLFFCLPFFIHGFDLILIVGHRVFNALSLQLGNGAEEADGLMFCALGIRGVETLINREIDCGTSNYLTSQSQII